MMLFGYAKLKFFCYFKQTFIFKGTVEEKGITYEVTGLIYSDAGMLNADFTAEDQFRLDHSMLTFDYIGASSDYVKYLIKD